MNARTCSSRSVGGAQSVTVTRLASHLMRLGFYMGYAQPGTNPLELLELARDGGARSATTRRGRPRRGESMR